MVRVGVFVGSLRKESITKKLAANVMELFPSGYETEFIEIGNLPLYNQDYDDYELPEEYVSFRNKMREIDAFLFVTPENNRSIPAVLKNALDIGSRPYSENTWGGKTAAIISQSPSRLSGFGANHHLRQILVCLNVQVLQQPEAYIGNSLDLFDESGEINNDERKKFLQSVVDEFIELIKKFE